MLTSIVSLTALVAAVLADGYGNDYGYGGKGGLVTVGVAKGQEANVGVSLKEVCYRNLYADAKLFKVKYNKEVAVQDVKHANVFLFDGKLLDENSQEFYYEEFCYKQFKVKEHHSDVKKESLGVVARRQLGGVGGISSGSFEGVGVGSGVGVGGAFDSGSFLNGYNGLDHGIDGGLGGIGGIDGGIGGFGVDGKGIGKDGLGKDGLGDGFDGGLGGFDSLGKGGLGGYDSLGKGSFGGFDGIAR